MVSQTGHLYVTRGWASRKLYVHRAVLLAFTGPCPEGMEARHLNGQPGDNRRVNLRWGTREEQRADDRRHGVRLGPKKLTSPRVRALRRMATLGLSTRQIGCRLGVSHTSVRKVLSGERFSHV